MPEAGGCFRSYFYTDSTSAKASSFYEAMGRKIEAKGFPDLSAFPKRLCLFDSKDMLNFLTCFCNSKNINFFFFFLKKVPCRDKSFTLCLVMESPRVRRAG